MKNLRSSEMCRFENWLWQHFNPAEVFEDFADKATEGIFALSVACSLDPSDIVLPLSEEQIFRPICAIHEEVRRPLDQRTGDECCEAFYPGEALSEDELRWVARHIQDALIPAC